MAYIGVSPSNGVRQKHTYTATASQTTFSGAGAEGVSLSYRDSNYVDVYRNGVKLGDADYTATSGTSIVLGEGAAVSDIIEIVVYDVFSVADTVSKADGGVFDGNVTMAGTLGVTGETTLSANLNLGDNDKAIFGAGDDLQIYHDGSDSYVKDAGTGDLYLQGSNNVQIESAAGANMIYATAGAQVRLFYNGSPKFNTTNTGIDVTGVITTDGMTTSADINFGDNDKAIFGAGPDLQIYHNGSNSYIQEIGTGNLFIASDANVNIVNQSTSELKAQFITNGAVNLFYDNSKKFETTSTGIDVTGTATMDGLTVDGITSTPFTLNTNVNGSQIIFNDGTSGTQAWQVGVRNNGSNDFLIYQGGPENIEFFTNNNTRQKISSNGDISFYEDTGTTPKLFWDASQQSLGVNTSSPTAGYMLHVGGSSGVHTKVKIEATTATGQAELDLSADPAGVSYLNLGDEDSYNIGRIGYFHSDNSMRFRTNSAERMRIDNLGVATITSQLSNTDDFALILKRYNGDSSAGARQHGIGFWDQHNPTYVGAVMGYRDVPSGNYNGGLKFYINNTGGAQASAFSDLTLAMELTSGGNANFYEDTGTTAKMTWLSSSEILNLTDGAELRVRETDSSNDAVRLASDVNEGLVQLYKDGSQTVQIRGDGANYILNSLSVGITSNPVSQSGTTDGGQYFVKNSYAAFARVGGVVAYFNRQFSDGDIIAFRQDGTDEGFIRVSGSTVTLVGGHLSRLSRLTGNNKDTSIVKGTVMTNLDEMIEWSHEEVLWTDEDELPDGVSVGDVKKDAYTEENEQLNKMAVSSVEGDANVAGVFGSWHNDEDGFNDMVIAMTGDMVIRIAQGTTVARGDLLMSAGDGTAKPQGDDIVRSKTIAKVTSTNVSHTYDDGTYLVPCVLMAC